MKRSTQFFFCFFVDGRPAGCLSCGGRRAQAFLLFDWLTLRSAWRVLAPSSVLWKQAKLELKESPNLKSSHSCLSIFLLAVMLLCSNQTNCFHIIFFCYVCLFGPLAMSNSYFEKKRFYVLERQQSIKDPSQGLVYRMSEILKLWICPLFSKHSSYSPVQANQIGLYCYKTFHLYWNVW